MSAIWGAIDLKGNSINKDVCEQMRRAFDRCVIDRYEEYFDEDVYMGCGIQYFTPEARVEKMPIHKRNIYYTADVVLDNRETLCKRLGISLQQNKMMADGEILYQYHEKYGKNGLNDPLGAYTYIWYDKSQRKIELVLDAVGNRCVYYRLVGDVFYFSSLLEPLTQVTGTELNDRWLVDFLAMDHLYMINETEETPYKDIYRIAPAQYISVQEGKIEKEIYWKPYENLKEYRYHSDNEYKEQFRTLWKEAVESTMRTDTETSILLSGGLDSTAVTSIAAPYLKKQGKKLYSYTSVPMQGYLADNSGYYIEDETEDVEKTAKFYGNIETSYIDLDGRNPWELATEEMKEIEMPYKSIQNFLWIADAMRKAYQKGSRMMLTGSYGNTTISYTVLNVYMNTLFQNGRFISLLKEVNSFSKTMKFSRKYALKTIWKESKAVYKEDKRPYNKSYVKKPLADIFRADERAYNIGRMALEKSKNYDKHRENFTFSLALRQIGEIETKHSLSTGVLLRDPTKDKRIIEFCIHLPMEQFCKNGVDRRLVKVYLKDIMPQHVLRYNKQGKQSADLHYRFEKNWKQIRVKWIELYQQFENSQYVECRKAIKELQDKAEIEDYSSFDLVRHMYTLLLLQYEFQKKNL